MTGSGLSYSASVTGPLGILSIGDGSGGTLTGNVDFIDISTYGKYGGINGNAQINLTGVTYSGLNPDLQFLSANAPGTVDVSFQFANVIYNLNTLTTGNYSVSTSYSGSILVAGSVVPEPSSWMMSSLGGLGALGFAFLRRKNA